MRNMMVIARREFMAYFNSPIAYVFMVVFLLLSSLNFVLAEHFFLVNQATMRPFFESLPWIFIVLVPAVAMRLWSEEKKSGTLELLLTLPMRHVEIMIGKFLAAWAFVALTVLLTLPMVFFVSMMGELDWGPVIGGYVAAILMGGAYLAIGMFVSALTKNQILSYVGAAVVCLCFVVMGQGNVLHSMNDMLPQAVHVFTSASFVPHFENISRGVIDTKDLVHFASVILLFLGLNYLVLDTRRHA
ncbi:MAG: ABC transporter permease subunit [Planctomycetota bacterium]|nr:ABC transporter permease subunit [Planctomycetota bacterium]